MRLNALPFGIAAAVLIGLPAANLARNGFETAAAAFPANGAALDSEWELVAEFRNGDEFSAAAMDHGLTLSDCSAAIGRLSFYYQDVNGRPVSVSYSCERGRK